MIEFKSAHSFKSSICGNNKDIYPQAGDLRRYILKELVIKFIDSAATITGITAFLYAASTAYTHGFFYAYSLDSNILDRNFHQIIYHGMILNIQPILTIPFVVAIIVSTHSGYKIMLSDYLHKGFEKGRKVVKLKNKLQLSTRKKRPIEAHYSSVMRKFWLIFILLIIFMLSMGNFELKGKEAATAISESIKSRTFSKVYINGNNSKKELAYLYCGARNCAALSVENQEIIYFPQNGHSYLK